MHTSYSRFWRVAATLPLATAAFSVSAQTVQPAGQDDHTGGLEDRATNQWRFHHEHVLGTSLEISVKAANLADAQRAEAAMLALFDHDDALLSTWRADSEVSRWAATRFEPVAVSPELLEVLASFDHWRERSGGALDASVETATRLWRSATAEGRVPTDLEMAIAAEAMQQPHWALDRERGTATRLSDVPLALGTFTKSYISSRAADAGLQTGATGVMLNVGGDVIVRGNLTQMVALADPRAAAENDAAMEYAVVRDRSVATSGSYRRGFELAAKGRTGAPEVSHLGPEFSHIIDPRTARPAGHVLSSTVIAQDATTAGALATAFSVLPVEESRTLAATVPGLQYMLALANGEQVRSANWPQAGGLYPVAYAPKAGAKGVAPAAGAWNAAFELNLELSLPRIDAGRYRRPYVAVWIEDADHFPVRTLALWTANPRWLNELKQWYRDDQVRSLAESVDLSRTIASATRPPGEYILKWDGKDNQGKLVKAGSYTVCVEAAREHGGYDIQRQELDFNGKPQQASLPAGKEMGAVTLDYRKR